MSNQLAQAKVCLQNLHSLHDMEGYKCNEVSKCIDYIQKKYLKQKKLKKNGEIDLRCNNRFPCRGCGFKYCRC